VNWLFANCGGRDRSPLEPTGLHRQLCDGFADPAAGITFFNNVGRISSRRYTLGSLRADDFEHAAAGSKRTIFGVEDCRLRFASRTSGVSRSRHVLVLRDPLNLVASRVAAKSRRPKPFPLDPAFVDLLEAYCAEYLGVTDQLEDKVLVSFNRFITDRSHRDEIAAALDVPNLDDLSEVSGYGGGSSFTGTTRSSVDDLLRRHEQQPVPGDVLELLLARPAIGDACAQVFGYDLAEVVRR
jgi:hypothetical protein